MTTFDLLVRGGDVVDGTGSQPFRADVGVRAGRISAVGDLSAATAATEVDARGLVVTPGFIDAHSHGDCVPVVDGLPAEVVLAGLRQGVTTEVCGNCGFSPAPAGDRLADVERHVGLLADFEGRGPGPLSWSTFAAYREALSARPMATNLAPLVGHGTLRAAAMGFDDRPATGSELAAMEALLDEALDDGAFGLSTGLVYAPATFAPTEEVVALARVAARHGRVYATHVRDEMDGVAGSLHEALHLGRSAGLPVHISHHKVAGRRNRGRSQETLGLLSVARAQGLDVTADAYPYTAGSTAGWALLPPWANAGGVPALLERLASASAREQLKRDWSTGLPGWQDLVGGTGWDQVALAGLTDRPDLEGLTVAEVAAGEGRDPVDTYCDLLLSQRAGFLVVVHMMDATDVGAILREGFVLGGSDGIPAPGQQHPRVAGAFARLLGPLRRDDRLFDLPQVVHRCTAATAERFSLRDRGKVRVGLAADLVVLDPATVADQATYEHPWRPPLGISAVVVGGQVCIEGGRDTGVRAGRVLQPS